MTFERNMHCIFKLALLWLICGCSPVSLLAAEPEADAPDPGRRWMEKSKQTGLESFEIEAYRQLSRMHLCQFPQLFGRGGFSVLTFGSEPKAPTDFLHAMGLKVLPILSEALDDETPTKTVTVYQIAESTKRVWKVNELVARLIRRLADREFVIGEWGKGESLSDIGLYPDKQVQFQDLILLWYQHNQDKTEEERKIADLESNLRNRLDAMSWLATHQSKKAAPFIALRIELILARKEVSSSTHAELATASLSLGLMGDNPGLSSVTKACNHLSYWIHRSYRPIEQGRSGIGSSQLFNLFQAYHGMALLGKKQEAIAELERLWRKYGREMEVLTRKEYKERLKKAQEWKEPPTQPEPQGE